MIYTLHARNRGPSRLWNPCALANCEICEPRSVFFFSFVPFPAHFSFDMVFSVFLRRFPDVIFEGNGSFAGGNSLFATVFRFFRSINVIVDRVLDGDRSRYSVTAL